MFAVSLQVTQYSCAAHLKKHYLNQNKIKDYNSQILSEYHSS